MTALSSSVFVVSAFLLNQRNCLIETCKICLQICLSGSELLGLLFSNDSAFFKCLCSFCLILFVRCNLCYQLLFQRSLRLDLGCKAIDVAFRCEDYALQLFLSFLTHTHGFLKDFLLVF